MKIKIYLPILLFFQLILNRQQEEDVMTYTLELQTEGLSPGQYSLYVFAEDGEKRKPFAYASRQLNII